MIDTLRVLGLTDWTSFLWGAWVMFVVMVIVLGLFTWGCNNAPTLEEYDDRTAA